MSVTLPSYDDPSEADWRVVNDDVMGGRSAGGVTVQDGPFRLDAKFIGSQGDAGG